MPDYLIKRSAEALFVGLGAAVSYIALSVEGASFDAVWSDPGPFVAGVLVGAARIGFVVALKGLAAIKGSTFLR